MLRKRIVSGVAALVLTFGCSGLSAADKGLFFAEAVRAGAEAFVENEFYNAEYSAEYVYSGSEIAERYHEVSFNEDDPDRLYTLGLNFQVGEVRNAKISITVESTEDTIWDGEKGVSSGTMYTVGHSWSAENGVPCPADQIEGTIKFTDETAFGACDIQDWDSGVDIWNGNWAQITLTDNDLSKLTFRVSFVAGGDSTWEYHPYDHQLTDEENSYRTFRLADSDDWETIDRNFINEQFGGITSDETYEIQNFDFTYISNGNIRIDSYKGEDPDVEIPSKIYGRNVTEIGQGAFAWNNVVKNVYVPESVTWIKRDAFSCCHGLESVSLPESLLRIGFQAFDSCDKLESIRIPGNVIAVDANAFQFCTNLKNVEIEDGVAYIGDFAFTRTAVESISLPDSVVSLGMGAFFECTELTSAELPALTYISKLTFGGCTALANVSIPEGVSSIENEAFQNCKSLKEIVIPDTVFEIHESAFVNCESLSSVIFGKSLLSIDERAFADCTSLTSVTIPGQVENIGWYAFDLSTDDDRGFKIYCYPDTAGEWYAIDKGWEYELIEDPAPTVPELTATAGVGKAELSWTEADGAEKYAVCVKVNDNWQIVNKLSDTSYTLTGLKAGTDYEVAVIAMIDGTWNKDFSNAVTVTPKAAESSKYPKVIEVEYSEEYHQFKLNWSAVDGATEYGIAVKLGGKWKVQTKTNKTYFTSPKLRPGSIVEMVICAKVNGKWDTSNINGRAFKVTVK